MTEKVRFTADDAEKIRVATINNIVSKIKKGGTPTAAEQKLIDEATQSPFRTATATTPELEECFGVTRQYLGQLETEGVIKKTAKNTWPVFETVQAFVEKVRNRKRNQWDSGGENADFELERAMLTKAKREQAEIQTSILKGRVHEGEAVKACWLDMLMAARAKLLSVGVRVAPLVAPKDRIAEARAIIDEMINEALTELADYSPTRIAERTDLKRLNTSAVPGDSELLGTAAEADGI